MQNNNYFGVGIMPKKIKFNRFFEAHRIINEGSEFRGLYFFRRWLNQDRRIYANKKEQYKIAPCGNNPIKAHIIWSNGHWCCIKLCYIN